MVSDEQIRLTVAAELRIVPELLRHDAVLSSLPGFDSVQMLMLMVALDEIGAKLPPEKVGRLQTFGDLLANISR